MRMRCVVAGVVCMAARLSAQTPAKLAPCDTSSVLAKATPIYDVGTATLTKACPAFAARISAWYRSTPAARQWTATQLVAALLTGVLPVDSTPALPPAPPPVVVHGGSCANEPAGATRFEDQAWNTALPAKWVDDNRGAWVQSSGAIVADVSAPMSGPSVVAGKFPNGSPGGVGPFNIYRPFASTEQFSTLYLCVVVKFSSDFDNTNGNVGSKFLWPAGDQVGGGKTYLTFNAATMDVGVNQQAGTYDPNGREMYANLGVDGHVASKRGRWIVLEFLFKANSAESAKDGALDVWIDGTHTHRYTDVRWSMAADRTWKSLTWNPTYGGGLHPVPHDQYEYIDHLRLSGVR